MPSSVKLYVVWKDDVWESSGQVLGIFSTREAADKLCDALKAADEHNDVNVFYEVLDNLCLDDASLGELRIKTLNCLQKKNPL